MRAISTALFAIVACVGSVGCTAQAGPQASVAPASRGGVTFVRPRCAEVRSCLLGQVVAAESSTPMARAAVFLEREPDDDPGGAALRFVTLTDDQGVFTVTDAPQGRYRLAVYKDARRLEVRGLELGAPGTVMVPVRLPPT